MLVRRDSTIATPKDLAGNTIGVISLQDFTTLTIKAWLEQSGVESSAIKFLELPNSAAAAATQRFLNTDL
jgi:ABC-type nitrate/sulfonate/bicarbonate transport system substrate-binding protein